MHRFRSARSPAMKALVAIALVLNLLVVAAWADTTPKTDVQAEAAPWQTTSVHWFVLEIAGSRAGWMRVQEETNGAEHRVSTETRMSMARAGQSAEVITRSMSRETMDEKPIEMTHTQLMASQESTTHWQFTPEGIVATGSQGGREHRQVHPLPTEPWLTPRGMERAFSEAIARGDSTVSMRTLDPSSGTKLVEIESRRDGERTITIDGREVKAQVWRSTSSLLPIEAIDCYDEEGGMLYQEIEMGIGKMVTRRTTEEEATRPARAGEQPELLIATFVTPSKPIVDAMRTKKATYRLRLNKGTMPAIPSAGAQAATVGDEAGVVELLVDVDARSPATLEELADADLTGSSPTIDAQDAMVKKLAARAVRGVRNGTVMDRADALRRFVYDYIDRKDLATAFASASETARTRSGDCSEHAVLLCAMLRSQGIPSRVASGLVYADAFAGSRDVFGWHMWTQAIIDGAWVDFDATLPGSLRHHAGHILCSTSSLSEASGGNEMASIVQLIGNLQIEVVDVSR